MNGCALECDYACECIHDYEVLMSVCTAECVHTSVSVHVCQGVYKCELHRVSVYKLVGVSR